MELGDFNRDARTDVAAVTSVAETLQVFLGNGGGGLGAPTSIGLPAASRSIDSGDLNRDGKLDLVVGGDSSTTNYYTLLGNGNGSTQAPTTAPIVTGDSVSALEVADMNGDGKADVLTTATAILGVRVFTQQPRGTPPAIATQPLLAQASTGGPATFNVAAIGQVLTYQWRRNGEPLANGGRFSGVTTAGLTVTPIEFADEGSVYDCVVSNACGTVTTRPVGLKVENSCPGDFNEDGTVDFFDYLDYVAAFGTPCP